MHPTPGFGSGRLHLAGEQRKRAAGTDHRNIFLALRELDWKITKTFNDQFHLSAFQARGVERHLGALLDTIKVGRVFKGQSENAEVGEVSQMDTFKALGHDGAHPEDTRAQPACSRELPMP